MYMQLHVSKHIHVNKMNWDGNLFPSRLKATLTGKDALKRCHL